MSRLKDLDHRINAHLRPGSADRRMEEEFAFHVESESERLRAAGVAPDQARRQALATFGGLQQYREEMREGRRANWLVDLRGDLTMRAGCSSGRKG